MKLDQVITQLQAAVICEGDLAHDVTGCYVSDLLSDVLAHSSPGDLWITQHTHPNIVAVAAVKGLSGIVIVGGKALADDTKSKALTEGVNIVSSPMSAFEAAGIVYVMIREARGQH